MLSKNNLSLFFQIILILYYLPLYLPIISIPFKLDILSIYKSYNSTNFYNIYFNRSIYLELNIGTPPQKTRATMNLGSSCFYFSNDGSNINNYHPINSSSFNLNTKSNTYTNLRNANDIIYFQNINKNQTLSFLLVDDKFESIKNNNYMPKIGLKYPFASSGRMFYYPCPSFLYELRQAKVIDKMMWTIKYDSKYNGEFIIGDDLSKYDEDKYPSESYRTTYFDLQYIIFFDSVYTMHKISKRIQYISDNKSSKGFIKAFININSGVIIGTSEYKNFIDNYFFNNLFKRKICQVDCVNDYLIYSCSIDFSGRANPRYPTINYYEEFPDLIFKSSKLELNFPLKSNDLFEQIFGRYYFLIIFKNNETTTDNDFWYLGEPFYKKYTFSINLDAKTIGFYSEKEINGKKVNNTKNNNKINSTKDDDDDVDKNNLNNSNKSMNKILKYFIEIIIVIGIALLAYYIGVTVREKRKKRANELKDENYEYMPEQNKDINENKSNQKKEKLVELNSQLGL